MSNISNYKETRRLLEHYQARAKKRFGQNFIIDPSVVKTIARKSGADSSSVTVEVGPGLGALTQQLAECSKQVYAYEIDPVMVEILAETMSEYEHVSIIHQDFLKADLHYLKKEKEIVVCANVPYYITTPILFKFLEADLPIKAMTLMMQKEIADRLNAVPRTKEYSSLSILFQYFFEMKKLMNVSKQSFYPQPNVDSSVVQFIPKKEVIADASSELFDFVHRCFNVRRKTLANNLKNMGYSDAVIAYLRSEAVPLQARPEELAIADYLHLFDLIKKSNELV